MGWILFNAVGLVCLYFLLSWKLQRSAGLERQIDKIRVQFNDLTVDMNDVTSRNIDLLETRIKEAKKLIRQLEKASAEQKKKQTESPETSVAAPAEEATVPLQPSQAQSLPLTETPSESLRQQVFKLAARGVDVSEIAEILGCQLQEAEMILSVRGNYTVKQ